MVAGAPLNKEEQDGGPGCKGCALAVAFGGGNWWGGLMKGGVQEKIVRCGLCKQR